MTDQFKQCAIKHAADNLLQVANDLQTLGQEIQAKVERAKLEAPEDIIKLCSQVRHAMLWAMANINNSVENADQCATDLIIAERKEKKA